MDRQDGKNPFDYETYIKPAASIKTMIELRAFCAEFFEKEIAVNNKATDEVRMTSYLKLITYSPNFFARARAVIPELQTSQEESFHQSNPNVQAAIDATYILRGHSDTKWEFLPEEPAWSKLVKDERERLVKAHERQASNGNFYPSPSKSTPIEAVKATPQGLPAKSTPVEAINATSQMSPETQTPAETIKPKAKLADRDLSVVPTFIPQNAMGSRQLVWSPTSGTRQLRAGETYHDQSSAAHLSNPMMPGHEMYHNQSPPAAGPVNPLTSSQDISPYVSLSQKAQTSERFPESASTTPQKSHTRKSATNTPASMTPLPIEQPHSPRNPASSGSQLDSYQYPFVPAESAPGRFQENGRLRRKYRKYTEAAPGHDRIEQMMGQTRLTDDPSRMSSSPQFSGPRYPVEYIRGHPGGEPFSAPPTVSSYGELDNTSQDTYGGLASPLHSQNFVPNVDIWGPQSAVSGAQMQAGMAPVPSNFMGPDGPMVPNPIAPSERMQSASLHAQEAILRAQDNTMPPIPPPGSMPPLEHWNMLYQREMEIVSRLQNANVPITDLQRRYIAMLGEARMNAVATRIPPRGSKSTRRWLKLLREMLEDIWKNQPGQMPLTPMIVARKQDYERAVNREIAMVMTETRPGGYPTGVNRGYNG